MAWERLGHFPADRMLLDVSFGQNMHDAAMRILPMARMVRGVRVTDADISGTPGKASYHKRVMAIDDILLRGEVRAFFDFAVQGKMNRLHGYVDETSRSTTEFLSVSASSGGTALRGLVDFLAAKRARLRLVATMPNFSELSEEDCEAIYGVKRLEQGQRLGRFALRNGIDAVAIDEDQFAGLTGDNQEEFGGLFTVVRMRPDADENGQDLAIRMTEAFAMGASLTSISPPANEEALTDLMNDISHFSQKRGTIAR